MALGLAASIRRQMVWAIFCRVRFYRFHTDFLALLGQAKSFGWLSYRHIYERHKQIRKCQKAENVAGGDKHRQSPLINGSE